MADHTLGTIRGSIEIDYDGAGIVRAIKDTDKLKDSGGRLGDTSDKILGSFARAGAGAFKFGSAISSVNAAGALLVGTLATVGPLAAAGFAAAPAVIVGYQSALIVAKLALMGVSEAMKAAGADEKKFEESLKGLSPEAQKFARAFRASLPALKAVQQSMQNAFFRNTSGQVAGVVAQVTKLSPAATRVAGSMGEVATNIVKTATSGKNIAALQVILGGVNRFLQAIKNSIGPVVTGFLNLARQGAAFGGSIGQSLSGALAKLASWLSSIDLKSVFAEAAPFARALGAFISDVAVIAKELFSIFIGDGQDTASILSTLADGMATFLQSAQGQEALTAIREAMVAIGGAAGQVFLALLQAIAPIIVQLAPGMGMLATQIASVLVPAINALAPLLAAIAGYLSENMSWIGPLAGAIGVAAGAYKVYAAAATAVTMVKKALNTQLALNTAAWIRNAAAATGRGLAAAVGAIGRTTAALALNTAAWVRNTAVQVASAAAGAGRAAAAWIASTAAIVANRIALMASAAVTGGAAVAAWIANTAAVVANRVAVLAANAAMLIVRGAVLAWTGVQWLLNAALLANPIGLVVIAIAALVAGIIYAWKNSETFRTIVLAVWAAIKTAIAATVNWITGTVWPAIVAAWNAIVAATKKLWSNIQSTWNAIKAGIQAANNAIRSIIQAVWNAIVGAIRTYINTYKAVIQAGFNAAKAVVNAVMNGIRAVVTAVWNAIVAVVRGAIGRVKSTINTVSAIVGIVKGHFNRAKAAIQSVLQQAVGVVKAFPGKVRSALGNLGGLLTSAGRALIQGFINGIKAMAGKVTGTVKGIVGSVSRFLPGSPAKEGPLSGKGYVKLRAQRFMGDFAKGIEKARQSPVKAITAATGSLGRTAVPRTSTAESSVSAALRNAVARMADATTRPAYDVSGGTRTYELKIGARTFTTLVTDAMTGNPIAVANAAAEGKRQAEWAGSRRK